MGAAVFSETGEIITLGSNEVPKALGGTYWADEQFDSREFRRGVDSNDQRKKEILSEIVRSLNSGEPSESTSVDRDVKNSQFMDALEYGRIIHAEMSAICDAARLGASVKNATLYCTTFPCHMCAKHIIAAGIKRVVFLEPYPKSLAFDLHADALEIEGSDRGQFSTFPAVKFEHFFGVTPNRYRELFERGKRKTRDGEFLSHIDGQAQPIMDIKFPVYLTLEAQLVEQAGDLMASLASVEADS